MRLRQYTIDMMGDCRWRGEEKRKAFAKAKAERERERKSVRCLLNITKYGLYPTSILAPPWGFVPFLLPFLLPYCFSDLSRFCVRGTIIFFFCFLYSANLPSSVLDPLCHIGYRPRSCHLTNIKICFAYHYLLATRSIDFCQVRLCATYIVRDARCQTLYRPA